MKKVTNILFFIAFILVILTFLFPVLHSRSHTIALTDTIIVKRERITQVQQRQIKKDLRRIEKKIKKRKERRKNKNGI